MLQSHRSLRGRPLRDREPALGRRLRFHRGRGAQEPDGVSGAEREARRDAEVGGDGANRRPAVEVQVHVPARPQTGRCQMKPGI